MNTESTGHSIWKRMLPQSRTVGWLWLAVAVVAFLLGLALSGGDSPSTGSHGAGTEAHRDQGTPEATAPQWWTCSMHPQIKLPKPGKCPICFMDLIPLETGGNTEVGPRQLQMSEAARELAQIETSPVRRAFAESEVRMVGKIAYDEARVAYITAWVPGRLDRLYADFTGITVKKGDHMVYMYSPELLATQEELLQALTATERLRESESRLLLETAQATLQAAREKLRLLGLTEAQISEVESTRKTSDHLTIYAPIGGVVVHKNALEGMYVQTGTRIYTIADLSHLWVLFEAYESDLPWIRYGQSVEFTSPSFPGETYHAVISFIDPVVDPQTRTVKIRAVVHNEDGRLKPDMFVRGIVQSRIDGEGHVLNANLAGRWIGPMHPEVVKDGPGTCDICGMDLVPASTYGYAAPKQAGSEAPLLIPASAPLITGKRAVVYVELPSDDGPLFEGRVVELGPRAGDFYVVRSGLKEGDRVVTHGAFKIDSELQIQAKPSMMSPEGGASPSGHDHGSSGDNRKTTSTEPDRQIAAQAETRPDGARSSEEPVTEPVEVSAACQQTLQPLYNSYFDIQTALAKDDFEAAGVGYAHMIAALPQIDTGLFRDRAHEWIAADLKAIRTAAEAGAPAAALEDARVAFDQLSRAMIQLHGRFGHDQATEYVRIHCPMAFDNRGADWLQTDDAVRNPYFGSRMSRCGTIQDIWAPGLPAQETP